MSEQIKLDRRYLPNSFVAIAAAVTIIAITLTGSCLAEAQSSRQNVPSSNASFGSIKQIDAGLLNVGYVEAGPTDGTPVILLHGWPYDIYTYADVAPLLASKGYHVFVPYLRGYGTTRFLSGDTFRNGQPSVVAVDIVNFMDALKIDKAIIAGFDWGARTADIMAVLWPERCKGIVSVSGYRNASEERKRMMYLCRCIQDEQDRAKFMALVTELNELLARKEHRLESKTKPNGN